MPRRTKYDILAQAIQTQEDYYISDIHDASEPRLVMEAAYGLVAIRKIRDLDDNLSGW